MLSAASMTSVVNTDAHNGAARRGDKRPTHSLGQPVNLTGSLENEMAGRPQRLRLPLNSYADPIERMRARFDRRVHAHRQLDALAPAQRVLYLRPTILGLPGKA